MFNKYKYIKVITYCPLSLVWFTYLHLLRRGENLNFIALQMYCQQIYNRQNELVDTYITLFDILSTTKSEQ